jgi:hypothetical protein
VAISRHDFLLKRFYSNVLILLASSGLPVLPSLHRLQPKMPRQSRGRPAARSAPAKAPAQQTRNASSQ